MYEGQKTTDLLGDPPEVPLQRAKWRSVGRIVFLLGITSLLTDISAEMVSATLPFYLLFTLHFSPFQVGVMDGLYQGAAVLVRVLSAVVSDRWWRPKEVAAAGYGLSGISKLGLILAGGSWTGVSSMILMDRIGKGIRTAPRDSMIALASPPKRLATAFGVHRAMDTAGAMLGPLLAVVILTIAPGAFDAVFVVSFCIAIVGVAVIALFVDNPAKEPAGPTKDEVAERAAGASTTVSLAGMLALFRRAEFRTLVIIGSALALTTVSDGLLYLAMQQNLSISGNVFPLLYVATASVFMALSIPAGRLADRIGRRNVFLLGYGLLAGVYVILLVPDTGTVGAGLALVLLGTHYALTDGVLMALAAQLLPRHLCTTGLALLTTGTGVARLIASTFYGAVWSWVGAERALTIFLGCLLVALALSWRTVRSTRRQ